MDPVVHFELPYDTEGRAAKFYQSAFGWKTQALGEGMGNYVLLTTSESDDRGPVQTGRINGGMFPRDAKMPGMQPNVVISVDDLKAAMQRITDAGGKVLGEPIEITGYGMYVSFLDTEGSRLALMEPSMREGCSACPCPAAAAGRVSTTAGNRQLSRMTGIFIYLVLIVFLAWKGMRSMSSALPGEATIDGEAYRYGEDQNKLGQVLATRVALAVPKHLRFDVRREGLFDRFSKVLGITREWQVGDATIDEHLYLDDDDVLGELLAQRADVRQSLRALLRRLRANGAKLQWLECRAGHLVLQVYTGFGGAPGTVRDEAVRFLLPLVEVLRGHERPLHPQRPRAEQRARLPLAVILVALLLGVGGGMSLYGFFPQRLIDGAALWHFAWIAGSGLFVPFLLWALQRVGPTPRRHRLLFQWVLLGVPAFIALSGFTIRVLDVVADRSAPQFIDAGEARVWSSYRRKFGTEYHLSFRSDDERLRGVSRLRLDGATYRKLHQFRSGEKSDRVIIAWHPGALGIPWVEAWN